MNGMHGWRSGVTVAAALSLGLAAQAATNQVSKNVFNQVPELRLAAADTGEKQKAAPAHEESHSSESVVNNDDYTERQSFDTYTQLEDGQPGEPGEIELELYMGWQTQSGESDPWILAPELEWTPKFLPNSQFGITVPLELGNGGVEGNGDISVFWLQRWIQEKPCHWYPSFSTLNEVRFPSGYHSDPERVDWTLTGILAKELGPGTVYMNAFLRSANSDNNIEEGNNGWGSGLFYQAEEGESRRDFQWGFRWGYKWRITDCFALIGDYIIQSNDLNGHRDQNIGEISAEWKVSDKLTVGPGILFGLDGQEENVNLGAGVKLTYTF